MGRTCMTRCLCVSGGIRYLVRAAEQLLETDGVYIHQSRLNPKAAFAGAEWEWHQDFATWHDRDGLKEPRALMVAVFIEDVTGRPTRRS